MIKAIGGAAAAAFLITFIACGRLGSADHSPAPAEGAVAAAGSMTAGRSGHTATLLGDGRVFIAGGMNGNGNYFETTEVYSSATGEFTPGRSMSARRVGHTATLLPDGKVLIAGGFNGDYLSGAEVYDPATGTFSPTGRMTEPRSEHVAVLLKGGKVLLAGGVGAGYTFLSSAELYDPVTRTFSPTGSLTVARESHTATLLKDGRVLITGGHKGRREGMAIHASAELYDPLRGTFTATGSMVTARHKHAATLLADGNVLIIGGSDNRDLQGAYDSAEVYDVAAGAFRKAGRMSAARYKIVSAAVTLRDGKALVAGGDASVEVYNPSTGRFEMAAGQMDTARFFSAATLLADGRVLITGGYDRRGVSGAQAWVYRTGPTAARTAD